MYIALHAPEFVFVHAGVVGVGERAIILPGRSFAGKTTLVAALVKAGAEYWSDEYAVLDADGLVHPYPKPLSVRINNTRETDEQPVENLGGRAGDRALPVAVIAFTNYHPGAAWALRSCTVGEGAVKLLEHSVAARSRPAQVLAAVRRAVADALVLEGDRGDADQGASTLLSQQNSKLTRRVSSAPGACACREVADTGSLGQLRTDYFRLAPFSASRPPPDTARNSTCPTPRSLDAPQRVDRPWSLTDDPDCAPDVGTGQPELAAPGER